MNTYSASLTFLLLALFMLASLPSQSLAFSQENNNMVPNSNFAAGRLEELKQREAELANLLASVRREKLDAIRSRPLTIGVIGFGRFGQFIARTFAKYGKVVVTSRSDYTAIAQGMGVKYVPLSDPGKFLDQDLDVIVVAVSILSFKSTIESLVPHIELYLQKKQQATRRGPLVVDVLSVKEHARQTLIEMLPRECDILCTHPMFGPDSGKHSWKNLNFVYEKTRINKVLLQDDNSDDEAPRSSNNNNNNAIDQTTTAHVEGVDRMERFLSIWEEEGCRMVRMSCRQHDMFAANSQFITHLMGRILGQQGLEPTPIDTSGFSSVMQLIGSTTADSFDLFYGLYKYNPNSLDTIQQLQAAMQNVVDKLQETEREEKMKHDDKRQKTEHTEASNAKEVTQGTEHAK